MKNRVACLLAVPLFALGGCGSGEDKRLLKYCQSTAPLAKVLPAATEINDVPRSDLNCPSQGEIVAVFGKSRVRGEKYYAYSVQVLDANSPYVSAHAGEDLFATRLKETKSRLLSDFDDCREQATNYKKRPRSMLRQIGGLEFCIYSERGHLNNLNDWHAMAIHDGFLLKAWVWEPETIDLAYADDAVDRVVPHVERFRFDALK